VSTGARKPNRVRVQHILDESTDTPFTPDGAAELEQRLDLFLTDLAAEARRIAKRHHADVVSPAHVRQAAEHLVTHKRRRLYALAGTMGGVVMGAAVSGILDAAHATTPEPAQLLATAGAGMAGAFALALQFAGE
jgi:hypothetical protein